MKNLLKILTLAMCLLIMASCTEDEVSYTPPPIGSNPSVEDDDVAETVKVFEVNGVVFRMTYIKGGSFTMGATSEHRTEAFDDELPTHQVTLKSFYMAQTEVTQSLWKAVMGESCTPTADTMRRWNEKNGLGDYYPAYYVSWDDCKSFIARLNSVTGERFSMPTEAQWEYAARGGKFRKSFRYSGGDTIDEVAWYYNNSGNALHPVASKYPNSLGLYDMTGSVWEWCSDWYAPYQGSSQTNPAGPSSGEERVNRGGGWKDFQRSCHISTRSANSPDESYPDLGLRLVLGV